MAVAFAAVIVLALLVGCGGGNSTDPGDGVEAAGIHLDRVEGEYLLAKVELDRAWYRHAETDQERRPVKTFQAEQEDLNDARRILKRCVEGDGLESCTEVESIREVVTELDHASRAGG